MRKVDNWRDLEQNQQKIQANDIPQRLSRMTDRKTDCLFQRELITAVSSNRLIKASFC